MGSTPARGVAMKTKDLQSRTKTIRQSIYDHALRKLVTVKSISKLVGIPEKTVADHLDHVARTAAANGKVWMHFPASCQSCGYEFEDRKKFTTPSKCPKCKNQRIDPPSFTIDEE